MILDHAFWTYFLSRKKQRLTLWFVFGSVFPDLVYFPAFCYLASQEAILNPDLLYQVIRLAVSGYSPDVLTDEAFAAINRLVDQLFRHPFVIHVRYAHHSLLIWGIVVVLTKLITGRKHSRRQAFVYGWGGHVVTDLMTHVTDAAPPFYPFSGMIIPGLVSYWNPAYHGEVFHQWNLVLTVLACLYLCYEKLKGMAVQRKIRNRQCN